MSKDSENRYEAQTRYILEYLRRDTPEGDLRYGPKIPRPFFIEFTGSPSSGKTTTITELDKFLRRQGFRVLRPQEGAEAIRHIERDSPKYNLRTGLYALQMLLDHSSGHAYDIVIFDRGIIDAYCWMLYWQDKELLSAEETKAFQEFFTSRLWANLIDICYIMISSPKVAIERELKIALSKKLGGTTNPKTVEALVERYKLAHKKLSEKFPQIEIIDTTNIGVKEMVEAVASNTLDVMEQKSKSGS